MINSSSKVFGVGVGKTGTSTLGRCLDILGYKVKSDDVDLTRCLRHGKMNFIFEITRHYQAFQDYPWPLLYREMDERYPNSKFILTTRSSSEKWFESLCKHADRGGPSEHKRLVFGYDMPHSFKEEHITFYEEHNRKVRKYFDGRENDFLEVCWETGSGWKEICDFLGHSIPTDADFPHANARPSPGRFEKLASRGKSAIRSLIGR